VTRFALEWFSGAELAAESLPGMPATERGWTLRAQRDGWIAADREGTGWRPRKGRGGGLEFHISNLTEDQQAALAMRYPAEAAGAPTRLADLPATAPKRALLAAERWEWFDRRPEAVKAIARTRLQALQAVAALRSSAVPKTRAMQRIAAEQKATVQSLYNWEAAVRGVGESDWLPFLAPHYAGGGSHAAECPADAWEELKADFLRLEAPAFTDCYRRLQKRAKQTGWTLPCERTLRRRMDALPAAVVTLARDGTDALKRRYPAQERDRSGFHALEAVNADGHLWDLFVKWPDGSVGRPMMVGFQDLYSGKFLSWRIDRSESAHSFRLAFGELVETWGIPDKIWLDNTRAAANKTMTGGVPTRFRFKARDEEPLGILPTMGVEVHWTLPFSGQSKPIERPFRDFGHGAAKDPRFAGAYTGNKPDAKPENYGSVAIPLDYFIATVGELMAEHNAREGRTGGVCGKRSFDQTFAESYAKAPIRRASEAQRRMWLLAAEAVRVRADSTVHLAGNRYWAPFLSDLVGQNVNLRFDPDSLHEPLCIYRADGSFLGEAECLEPVGFDSTEAARQHGRARRAWMRAQKDMLHAERRMSVAELAALHAAADAPAPEKPEARVVRAIFPTAGATALRAEAQPDEDDSRGQALMIKGLRELAEARGRHLVAVPDDDGD
jgi:putative transposase